MTGNLDHWRQVEERLAAAGLIVPRSRIRHILGGDEFNVEFPEPLASAARAYPRIVPLIRRMLEEAGPFDSLDNVFLRTAFERWEAAIRAENPGIDPFALPSDEPSPPTDAR